MAAGGAAIDRARNLLLEAALDPATWPAALDAVAEACGARNGQLIRVDDQGGIMAHWLTQTPEDLLRKVEDFGLSNPHLNPRMKIGLSAPLMTPMVDHDLVDAETRDRSPIYAELFNPYDLAFNAQAVLLREDDALARLSVTRTRRQGPLDAAAISAFTALLPHAQAAVRIRAAMEASRTTAMVETLDTIGTTAFLLDASGRVAGLSRGAEALAHVGDLMQVHQRVLRPARHADRAAFSTMVQRALAVSRGIADWVCGGVDVQSLDGGKRATLEVQPLPSERAGLGHGPAVMVIERPRARLSSVDQLRRTFGLTKAEAEVALSLARGEAVPAISEARNVSAGTVRSQIQAIYQKMGVHRQAELVLAIRDSG